jgi:hypothetical protein
VCARAVEQGRAHALVAAHERAQVCGVLFHLAPRHERVFLARARVTAREQSREVAVAAWRLDEQEQRVGIGVGRGIVRRHAQRGARRSRAGPASRAAWWKRGIP